MAEEATSIIDRLEEIEATASKLVEAGKRNDWREAEMAVRRVQTTALNVARYVEMANDIQRGQIR